MLYNYGVRCVIDLRSQDEVMREPDKMPGNYQDVEYLLIVPHYVMESPPENMELTFQYLYENYQNIEEYFKSIGLTGTEIEKLRKKLAD